MLAGAGKQLISPEAGIDLAGFGRLDRKNVGIHDDLYVSALILQNNKNSILIICADIIGFGFKYTKNIKNEIKKKYGLNENEILLSASHTHSGPQTLENMLSTLGRLNDDYMERFKNYVMKAVEIAFSSMEKAEIFFGETVSSFGINRRLIVNGKANFQPNENGIVDNSVQVIKIMSGNNTKAVLFSYACHPSTIGADYVSADFPGQAKRLIENEFGDESVALFMQGCCGNIRVSTVKDKGFRPGTWEDVNEFGVELGSAVVQICKYGMKKIIDDNIDISTKIMEIKIPYKEIPEKHSLEEAVANGNAHLKLWAETLLSDYDNISDTALFVMQRISLNKNFHIIAMSGEVVVEYGLYSKNMDPDSTVIPVAYSNGVTGYIPTAVMLDQGGYEPDGSTIYYLYSSQFKKSVESIVYDALRELYKEDT